MIKFSHLMLAAVAMAPLAGCMAEAQDIADEDMVAEEGAAISCPNPDGTNAMLAALAVAIGTEVHRWQITKDFYIYRNGQNQEVLGLTSTGLAQCSNGCKNVKSLLSYQDASMDQVLEFRGGKKLSSWAYASRLTAGFKNQQTCDARTGTGSTTCPAEEHKLTLASVTPGGCDTMATYNATKPTGAALANPAQLRNKLLWAMNGGLAANQLNPYIAFSSTGSTVSIDPVGGLTPPTPAPPAAGACWDGCSMYSETNIATQCCLCNGATKKFKVSPLDPNSYNCK